MDIDETELNIDEHEVKWAIIIMVKIFKGKMSS